MIALCLVDLNKLWGCGKRCCRLPPGTSCPHILPTHRSAFYTVSINPLTRKHSLVAIDVQYTKII